MLDANTFSNNNVINYISENFIPLKIDAESEHGTDLFQKYNGTGYPMIIFIDTDANELDRFYGYYPPDWSSDSLYFVDYNFFPGKWSEGSAFGGFGTISSMGATPK